MSEALSPIPEEQTQVINIRRLDSDGNLDLRASFSLRPQEIVRMTYTSKGSLRIQAADFSAEGTGFHSIAYENASPIDPEAQT